MATPVNVPRARPGARRIVLGSAAAVAAGLCDTALGTDTGGSCAYLLAFSGLYRHPPHARRLDLSGMLPQAPTSDTTAGSPATAATSHAFPAPCWARPSPTRCRPA